jgi:NAD(P)-dependent dehydrogenase (short-subunit alcohol dehydrogenase family)
MERMAATMTKTWTADDIGDLTGTTALITGANSGLGLESAKALAAHGAQVVLAGRDPGRLADAAQQVAGSPLTLHLDLADLSSVRKAAAEVSGMVERIDILMNNAGVMATPYETTVDGFERQIGTNHLGHFALTGLLLPLLHHEGARVVNVSSGAHRMGSLDPEDLHYKQRDYSSWPAYGQSKLANLLFTAELDRRAQGAGWDLVAVAAHPGYAATNLQTSGPWYARNPLGKGFSKALNLVLAQSASAGAWPQLYAAVGEDVAGNDYFGPRGRQEMRGNPTRVGRRAEADDEALAVRLWEVSEEQTGVVYDWS